MRSFFPIIFASVVILIFGLAELLLLRVLNREWWRKPWVRRMALLLPVAGFVMIGLWGLGEYLTFDWLAIPAAALTALVFVLEVGLMLSLPISGALHLLNRLLDWIAHRRKTESEPPINHHRRILLKGAAAATPLLALAGGTGGLVRAFAPANLPRKEFHFPNLPPEMEGLKIWHVSDIHLRHYVTLDDLEHLVESARPLAPDLVLVTGDVADDLTMLPEALDLLAGLKAPLGCFASLGNHEYFRGVDEVRAIFDRSPVPLLVNQSLRVPVNGTSMFVGGIDDPRHMGAKDEAFYVRAIDQTLTDRRNGEFAILMSHRPDAFDTAAARDIPLTLAGHTHGGQLGLFGRSAFESYWHDRYLWGAYRIGGNQLYTSSGVGHWFPFRLGCPPEAPLIVLRRGDASLTRTV